MVLLVLAVIWAAVLVPPMWRSRADGRPADSIKQFHRHLRVLNGTEPHGYSRTLTATAGSAVITAPMPYRSSMRSSAELRRRRTLERRRNVLFSLAGSAAFTLLLAVVGVKFALMAHLLSDIMLVAYVGLLARMRAIAAERELKLRFLPQGGNGYHDEDASAWGDISAAFATAAVQ